MICIKCKGKVTASGLYLNCNCYITTPILKYHGNLFYVYPYFNYMSNCLNIYTLDENYKNGEYFHTLNLDDDKIDLKKLEGFFNNLVFI
jgi:hypothetical protein